MSGLESIIREIEKKASEEADAILKEAQEYCEAYMTEEKERIAKEIAEYEKTSKQERERYEQKEASKAEAMERSAILNAKQRNIDLVMEKAYAKLIHLPVQEYFQIMERLLAKHTWKRDGEVLFGRRDLERMPEDFEKRIAEIATQNNISLKLIREAVDIPDGFILRYGNIEENCTLKALFSMKQDQLRDIASGKLFI